MYKEIVSTIECLYQNKPVTDDALKQLLQCNDSQTLKLLLDKANQLRAKHYGNTVYIRGLIEFTNYCKNNCYYCGIRRDNINVPRYRLTPAEILDCCKEGYKLGFRTFVLQGGEDGFFHQDVICDIVSRIKRTFPDCAVTLSIGEWPRESYQAFYDAGADRYLLRHETACEKHYNKLHPQDMSLSNRIKCLYTLRDIGFQTGAGFMVGSPYQTTDDIVKDLRFLQELKPHMIGIGPYISHRDTPFKDKENGSLKLTLKLLSILRLMHPMALIPSTTALRTLDKSGTESGLKAGANVIMPNLSPACVRDNYSLYDNKLSSGSESAQMLEELKQSVSDLGYEIVCDIGHSKVLQ